MVRLLRAIPFLNALPFCDAVFTPQLETYALTLSPGDSFRFWREVTAFHVTWRGDLRMAKSAASKDMQRTLYREAMQQREITVPLSTGQNAVVLVQPRRLTLFKTLSVTIRKWSENSVDNHDRHVDTEGIFWEDRRSLLTMDIDPALRDR